MPNNTYARTQGRNRFSRRKYSRYVTKGYLRAVVGVPENKWVDIPTASYPIMSTPPQLLLLNPISEGTSPNERVGSTVSNKSLHLRLSLSRGQFDTFVRIIIFWWLDGTRTDPATPIPITPDMILETVNFQSPLNRANGKSFWVKFDRTYSLASGQSALQVDEIWRRLKCQSEYPVNEPPLPADNQPTSNSLHLLALSTIGSEEAAPILQFHSRLTYLDT